MPRKLNLHLIGLALHHCLENLLLAIESILFILNNLLNVLESINTVAIVNKESVDLLQSLPLVSDGCILVGTPGDVGCELDAVAADGSVHLSQTVLKVV
jgi:hypothetical protein